MTHLKIGLIWVESQPANPYLKIWKPKFFEKVKIVISSWEAEWNLFKFSHDTWFCKYKAIEFTISWSSTFFCFFYFIFFPLYFYFFSFIRDYALSCLLGWSPISCPIFQRSIHGYNLSLTSSLHVHGCSLPGWAKFLAGVKNLFYFIWVDSNLNELLGFRSMVRVPGRRPAKNKIK